MARAKWSIVAEHDLIDIAYYFSTDGGRPLVAHQVMEDLKEKALDYAENPLRGQIHPQLPDGSRYFRYKLWAVVYQPRDYGLFVLRVVDLSRDFASLFR